MALTPFECSLRVYMAILPSSGMRSYPLCLFIENSTSLYAYTFPTRSLLRRTVTKEELRALLPGCEDLYV